MFRITEPSEQDVVEFISSQRNLPFTYAEVGATNATPPSSYRIDHNRVQLGEGEATYQRAVQALKSGGSLILAGCDRAAWCGG